MFYIIIILDDECCFPFLTSLLSSRRYTPYEVSGNDFNELILSSHMGADHLPDQYYYELKRLAESNHNNNFKLSGNNNNNYNNNNNNNQ